MHAIESELIKVTKFKPAKKYLNRQDYLKALLSASTKLSDDDFENVSDDLAKWCNEAVEAFNSKQELPDFDELDDDDDEDGAGPEAEDDEEAGDEDPDEDDDDDDESDDEDEDEEADEPDEGDDDGEDPVDSSDSADEADGDDDDDEELEEADDDEQDENEPEEDEKPVKAKGKKAPAKKAVPAPKKAPAKAVKEKAPPKEAKPKKPKSDDEEVYLDKWGCMVGSKNSQALAMFEKGATTTEVKKAIGGTYYNILKKMTQDGHRLEKQGALMTLIHKSDLASKKPAKAPAKKAKK